MADLPNVTDSETLQPSPRRTHSDNYVLNEIKKILLTGTGPFGNSIRLGTTNEADIASHYDYSPERLRLFVNGARQFVQYTGEPAQFEDRVDSWALKPQADGEVVTLKTAERFRYVVQYALEWSLAFQINQELNANDIWAVGYGDPDLENATGADLGPNADGWFVYQTGAQDADVATVSEVRDGTVVSEVNITLNELPLTWGRLAGETNWYNVGETNITESFTETNNGDTVQRNIKLGTVGNDNGKGPTQGNQRITASVKVGSASAGSLELEVGSLGLRTLGDITAITRQKTFSFSESLTVTNTWQPVLAIRTKPPKQNVNVQIDALEVLEHSGNDDIFALLIDYDSSKVADSNGNPLQEANWGTPPELSAFNSAVETNTNAARSANSVGNVVASMANPGGYQVGFGSLYSSGSGSSAQREKTAALVQKRQVPNGDYAVLLLKSASTGTVKGQISTEQDW